MRTLHVIDSLRVGGAERALVELARAGASLGVSSAVCVTRDGLDLADELPAGVLVRTLGRRSRWDAPVALARLRRLIAELRPDALHVHGRSSARFVAFGRALGVIRAPYLFQDHYGGPWRPSSTTRRALEAPAAYIAASRRQLREARRAGAPRKRSCIIEPALDLSRFPAAVPRSAARARLCAELDLDPGVPLGVCVAGIRREKGIDALIEALAEPPRPKLAIVVVGGVRDEAYARGCRARVAALGLGTVLHFLGERRDLPELLAAADFAVHPARVESGPLSLIEQLAAGLPVAATRVGAVAEAAERAGVSGFVHPDDTAELRRGLEELIRLSAAERRARGEHGRAAALRLFSLERRAPEWVKAYRAVASGRVA